MIEAINARGMPDYFVGICAIARRFDTTVGRADVCVQGDRYHFQADDRFGNVRVAGKVEVHESSTAGSRGCPGNSMLWLERTI